MIYRYPRYGELFDAWLAAGKNASRARRVFESRRHSATCRCSRNWHGSMKSFWRTTKTFPAWFASGRDFTRGRAADARTQADRGHRAKCCRSTATSPPADRSKSPPRLSTIRSCRCSAIRNIAEVAHPYVPLPPRFPLSAGCPASVADRARVHGQPHRHCIRSAFGHRKDRSPMKSFISPPKRDSSGPQPTTAFSAARCSRAPCQSSHSIVPIYGSRATIRCT